VTFTLTRKDLSEWNVVEQAWRLQQGAYSVWVGSSSKNLPARGRGGDWAVDWYKRA